METIIVGTRGSQLALKQTEWVIEQLKRIHPEKNFVIKKIKTKGDKILDSPLSKIVAGSSTKGLFTKEIEEALLRKEIDFAVHSMKDLPTDIPKELTIGAMPQREETADVLITKNNLKFEQLPKGAKIGTSSLRRKAQILAQRPDLEIVNLRGNLDTRIRKLREQDLDGIVVAYAGLERLQVIHPPKQSFCGGRASYPSSVRHGGLRRTGKLQVEGIHLQILTFMFPAVGQGAIGVEIREVPACQSSGRGCGKPAPLRGARPGWEVETKRRDEEIKEMVSRINDEKSATCVFAERAFLKKLGGGCQVPIGVRSEIVGASSDGVRYSVSSESSDMLALEGIVLSPDGKKYFRDKISGPLKEAINLGVRLAENLISLGAKELLLQ